jgi:hypothetical protein
MHKRALLALVAAGLFAAALHAQPYRRKAASATAPPVVNGETQLLWNQYERALYDSTVYERWNIRKLRPLTIAADGTVLVATLTSRDGKPGDTITAGNSGMWVTGVPEVQSICQKWRGTPDTIEMRLRQLIGLPPDAEIPRFLVLRAQSTDIFRPAVADAITTDYPCALDDAVAPPADCGNVFPSTTTPSHYQWMATASFDLHSVPNGYPWTHLGYTYNWAPGEDRYGTSEYVIRGGKTAVIIENVAAVQYCTPALP